MYNLDFIFLIGILSYIYLLISLLNKKYTIIFLYFIILFIGYLIIGKKIFLYNLVIIIIDILFIFFNIKEGNSNYDKAIEKTQSDGVETSPTLVDAVDNMSDEEKEKERKSLDSM
tara:strand:- start:7158 stop:7502 length:345 start_codon:yes stop_codon:yes gene_type:complete